MTMEDLYRLLRASHVQAQGIVDTVPAPLLVLDEGLRVQAANRAFYETFKVDGDATIGQRLHELGNGQWDIPELRRLLAEVIPRSTAVIDYMVEHEFQGLGRRTMLLTARTLFRPDQTSHSLLLSIVDATERYRREAARDLLFGELRHRIRNLLGVAQSIARQTSTVGRSAEEYRDVLLGRFGALVAAQELAFASAGEKSLQELVERVLAPYAAAEAVIIGPAPAVALAAPMITPLSLVLHELATNAAKYGALSVRGGRVRILWRLDETDARLRLAWSESGGPPVTAPASTGYGTELIRSTTTHTLGGEVVQRYETAGLETELVIPLGMVPD